MTKKIAYYTIYVMYSPITLAVHLAKKIRITKREWVYVLIVMNMIIYPIFNKHAVAFAKEILILEPIVITKVITNTVYSGDLTPDDEYYKRLNQDDTFSNYINGIHVKRNNPGNLRCAGQPNTTCDNGFAVFPNIIAGFRGLIMQLDLDQSRNLTLEQFISKYSPAHENDTPHLINRAEEESGINRKDNINKINTIHLAQIMTKQEWSIRYNK